MIEKFEKDYFTLSCDHCGDICDEIFDDFQDVVNYKTDKDNGWRSIKDKNGDWQELCPACNTPEIIGRLKGFDVPGKPRDETDATDLALKALEDL
jgi:hypothetical protein